MDKDSVTKLREAINSNCSFTSNLCNEVELSIAKKGFIVKHPTKDLRCFIPSHCICSAFDGGMNLFFQNNGHIFMTIYLKENKAI